MNGAVGVLGPGAVGGALAVHLASAAVHVVCVPRPEAVQVLALAGLTLEVDGGSPIVARPEVAAELVRPVALLLVTVKSYGLEEAIERVDPAAVADGVVVPLLNGLEHVDVLRARFGDRVATGSISRFEAYRVGRYQIIQETPSAVVTLASGHLTVELEQAAGLLLRGGLEVRLEVDEKEVLWRKAARLSVLAAATSASGRTVGALRDDPSWRDRLRTAIGEACAIAAADGVPLAADAQWRIIGDLDADLTTSTARDVAAGKPSELDAITGAVVRAGERLGVPCPVLAGLYAEAKARAG
jgi:2-dehydropantoate 2-reductase